MDDFPEKKPFGEKSGGAEHRNCQRHRARSAVEGLGQPGAHQRPQAEWQRTQQRRAAPAICGKGESAADVALGIMKDQPNR
jgi:hypothetical protein